MTTADLSQNPLASRWGPAAPAPKDAPAPKVDFEGIIAGRQALNLILDLAEVASGRGDLLDVLVVTAIISANLGHLACDPQLNLRYSHFGRPAPVALRRPISINALAISLHLPFETVRRRVTAQAAQGRIVYTPNGVYAPAATTDNDRARGILRRRYDCFWRFREELQRAGLVPPSKFTPPPAEDPAAPVAGVNRIITAFWLRSLEPLRRGIPDPLTGLIYLAILRGNVEHLLPEVVMRHARAGEPAPDNCRPVRMADLSRRLSVPYETTRRHVAWLVKEGYCLRIAEGLRFPPEILHEPGAIRAAVINVANMKRMLRQVDGLMEAQQTAAAARGA